MRYTLIAMAILFAVAGCTKPKAKPGDYTGMISVVGGLTQTVNVKPAPKPSPSGKCDNCGGDGELGDGTIKVKCPVCGGDGILDKEAPEPVIYVPLVEPEKKPEAKPEVPVADCPSGMCDPTHNPRPAVSDGSSYQEPQRRGLIRGRFFGRRRG